MTPTTDQLEEMEREFRAAGMSDQQIGEKLRELADKSEAEAEAPEPEPEPEQPQTEQAQNPPEGWKPCAICRGMGILPAELQPSKTDTQCPDCGGMGEVLTGSLKPEAAALQCFRCNGNGYVAVTSLEQPATPDNQPPQRVY